jgi:hypothetical protein
MQGWQTTYLGMRELPRDINLNPAVTPSLTAKVVA